MQEVDALFERPVDIKDFQFLENDGILLAGDVFHSMFGMAAVLKPKDPRRLADGTKVRVRFKVVDEMGRGATGENTFALEVKVSTGSARQTTPFTPSLREYSARSIMISHRLKNRILARVFTAFPLLAARWGKGLAMDTGGVPWAEPRLPLRQALLALVTTGGVHLTTQPPFDMTDPDGDPSFREVPVDTPRELLCITHDYYDHRDAEGDLNLVFPVQRLEEFRDAGALGGLLPLAYSLMGHITGAHLQELQEETAVEIARRLAGAGVDYVLLVPA